MFIKPSNNNQVDFIERKTDESNGMTTINTTHLKIGIVDFPNSIPIDVLCESTENSKKIFFVYSTSSMINCDNAVITIILDDKNRITLSPSRHLYCEKDKPFRDNKYYFPISEKDFKSCCIASSLELEIDEANMTHPKKEDGKELIDYCKLLYQNTFEKEAFPEAATYLQEKKKELSIIIDKLNINK